MVDEEGILGTPESARGVCPLSSAFGFMKCEASSSDFWSQSTRQI